MDHLQINRLHPATSSHRVALAALLCVERTTRSPGDILKDGIELVEPAIGVLGLDEALAVIAGLPKPLVCLGERTTGSLLRVRCRTLDDEAVEKRRHTVQMMPTESVSDRLGSQGHIAMCGGTTAKYAVLLNGDEYRRWREDYRLSVPWAIDTEPHKLLHHLGADMIFWVRSPDIVVREEILSDTPPQDDFELARERIELIERAMMALATELPVGLAPDERDFQLKEKLQRILTEEGFVGLERRYGKSKER